MLVRYQRYPPPTSCRSRHRPGYLFKLNVEQIFLALPTPTSSIYPYLSSSQFYPSTPLIHHATKIARCRDHLADLRRGECKCVDFNGSGTDLGGFSFESMPRIVPSVGIPISQEACALTERNRGLTSVKRVTPAVRFPQKRCDNLQLKF